MAREQITVEVTVPAPPAEAWNAYTSPDRIKQWNFASDDWHCPSASVDLREGGAFTARMEAKDGSLGFDFAGTYTRLVEQARIEYAVGDRLATVVFTPRGRQTHVTVTFDPESTFPVDQQRRGWQAILDNFARHVGASAAHAGRT